MAQKQDRYSHLARKQIRRNGVVVRIPDRFGSERVRALVERIREYKERGVTVTLPTSGFFGAVCDAEGLND